MTFPTERIRQGSLGYDGRLTNYYCTKVGQYLTDKDMLRHPCRKPGRKGKRRRRRCAFLIYKLRTQAPLPASREPVNNQGQI